MIMYEQIEQLEMILDVIKDANRRLVILKENIATSIKIDSIKGVNKWRHDAMICEMAINRLKQRYNRGAKALTPFTLTVVEDVEDEEEEFSTCCGAPIIYRDICTKCKEHV